MKKSVLFYFMVAILCGTICNANTNYNTNHYFDDGLSLDSHSFLLKRQAIDNKGDENDPYENACIYPVNLGYDEVDCIKQGLAVVKKNGKYGYVNQNGKLIVKPKYDKASNIFKEYQWGAVELNNKTGLIDKTGKVIVPIIYDEFVEVDNKTLSAIKNGKFGIIDVNNNVLVPFEYEFATNVMENGLALLKKNNKYGVMDKNNKIIIDFDYDEIYKMSVKKWTHIIVKKDKKYGVFDLNGNKIIPLEYDAMTLGFMSGLLGVKKGDKWGFINKNNEVVLDFVYDMVSPYGFMRGVSYVLQNGEGFNIDKAGRRLSESELKRLLENEK